MTRTPPSSSSSAMGLLSGRWVSAGSSLGVHQVRLCRTIGFVHVRWRSQGRWASAAPICTQQTRAVHTTTGEACWLLYMYMVSCRSCPCNGPVLHLPCCLSTLPSLQALQSLTQPRRSVSQLRTEPSPSPSR
jgi:hypothetical protein